MRVGNNFSWVGLSMCLPVCLPFWTTTCEPLKLGTSFSVNTYIFPIFRSGLSTRVILSKSRSNKYNFIINIIQLPACIPLKLAQRLISSEGRYHLMWRPYQLQMTKMSTYFKCFCDLCAMRMVCFWPKSILVLIRFITFLLLLTTTKKYPPRGSDKHFFFTTSSWNVSIARHGVLNGNYPLFYFCEFSESHLGKTALHRFSWQAWIFHQNTLLHPKSLGTVDRFQEKSCYIHWTALRNQIIDYFSPFEITFNYTLNALWNSTSSSLQKKIKYQTGYMTTVKNTSFNMREVFFSKASLR